MSKDLIIGAHSIVEALLNSERIESNLIGVEGAIEDLKKAYPEIKDVLRSVEVEIVKNSHILQQEAEKIFKSFGFKFSRVPGNILLVSSRVPFVPIGKLFDDLGRGSRKKVLCLDQVTDPQNAAAVLRTASF